MRVLVNCEYSATVRDAFRAMGHDAYSCDLLETEGDPRYHLQCDCVAAAYDYSWDMMICHYTCRVMANSGAKHLYLGMKKENGRNPERWAELERDAAVYRKLKAAPIPRICMENSVMHRHAFEIVERGFTQFVHPYFFGSPFFKLTQLELIGLPPLRDTNRLTPPKPGTAEHRAWSKVHRMGPSADRGKERARFDPLMAAAMAAQWGSL